MGAAHQQQGHHHWLQAGDGSSVRFCGGDSDSKSKDEETMESPATMTDNHEVGDKEENNQCLYRALYLRQNSVIQSF